MDVLSKDCPEGLCLGELCHKMYYMSDCVGNAQMYSLGVCGACLPDL